jgi:hypothetical protein
MLLCQAAQAQLEEIVVTGSRVESYDMPAIAVVKQADFLVQNIRLINDSRSPDLRRQEIFGTIERMLASAERVRGIRAMSTSTRKSNSIRGAAREIRSVHYGTSSPRPTESAARKSIRSVTSASASSGLSSIGTRSSAR